MRKKIIVLMVGLLTFSGVVAQTGISVIDRLSSDMVLVEGGTFLMGGIANDPDVDYYVELPAHEVTVSSFLISKYEVTQELWLAVMDKLPGYHYRNGDMLPVTNVLISDCQAFINKLNILTGKNYRMVTEAEWEFAARGGNKSHGYRFAGSDNVDVVGWYRDNTPYDENDSYIQVKPVGQKQPNELGLYDMSGNAAEWCQDNYGGYPSEPQSDPLFKTTEPPYASMYVHRGGSYKRSAEYLRVSSRMYGYDFTPFGDVGFRLAMTPEPVTPEQKLVKSLIVETLDGAKAEYPLIDGTKVKVNKPEFIIESEGATITYQISELKRMAYGQMYIATDIQEMSILNEPAIRHDAKMLNLTHLNAGVRVEVYDAEGRLLFHKVADASGTVSYSIASLPAGAYIVKANRTTYKIMKR